MSERRSSRRRTLIGVAALEVWLVAGSGRSLHAARTFAEDFSSRPVGLCHADGTIHGALRFVYDGLGCNGFLSLDGNTVLVVRPRAAISVDETHAGLATGPLVDGDVSVQVSLMTTRQLRIGAPPNPWEVGWVAWHYRDDAHFYYFVPKPNGWELGKTDPAYPGGQRFLAAGDEPAFPIGRWYRVAMTQTGTTMAVSVDGKPIVTFTDEERPYSAGRVALYTEDADVYFDDIEIKPADGAVSSVVIDVEHR